MKYILLVLIVLLSLSAFGQGNKEKTLYVIDSIPIFNEINEEEGSLSEEIISSISVVTDKANFGDYEIYDFDKIIFIFTKEYANRPEEIKNIPTSKKMYIKEGKLCLIGSPSAYTGKFIDYYYNGMKKREGFLKNGLADGLTSFYYKNGKLKSYKNLTNGIENGESAKYFPNGQLKNKGVFKNGKEEGLWEGWYSTGVLKKKTEFKAGKAKLTKNERLLNSLYTKGINSFNRGDFSKAVDYYSKALELDPNFSDIYFHRSRAYLYDLKFDEAITDCNKAIALEPLYMEAYSNRAFVRIRKYEFIDGKNLSQNNEITVYATKKDVEIPTEEKTKICNDLRKGYELGDTKTMISEAIKKYCK